MTVHVVVCRNVKYRFTVTLKCTTIAIYDDIHLFTHIHCNHKTNVCVRLRERERQGVCSGVLWCRHILLTSNLTNLFTT